MSQWGQGQQGFQIPMQTGYNPQFQRNPQFQQQQQPPQFQQQNPQFQQPQQFQQTGFAPNGIAPQPTGFPAQPQRPQGFQQVPQQGFIQSQPTGFVGSNFQQQSRPPPPPVPPVPSIPTQFQSQNQGSGFLGVQQQPNRFLSPSPALGGPGLAAQPTGFGGIPAMTAQPTGFGGRPGMGQLMPQMTGFVDPRLQMMSSTFMPLNTSAPYTAGGAPQLPPQQNLQNSIQQHNQAQRGSAGQQMPWSLSKAEKKNYNNIFRSWDAQNTGFINGTTALEVFGQSGLPKDDLARIWTLADIDDRGKLNIAEFHVAMGLIFRRLNGMPIPDQLPQELIPPSARDLDSSVDLVKDILKHETRSRSPVDGPVSRLKNRSFNSSSSSLESGRDATIYKHSDSEPPGGFYKPRSRHVDRDAVRSRNDSDSPSADLSDMKRQLASTAQMLDRAAEADATRTAEDEELDREMDDLRYRVKRVQEDLDYVSRGPRTGAKDEERRKLERELLSLMHERVPEVERKIKARDERKEREKRQWTRDRDRANERFGRYDPKEDSYSPRRFDDRDRPYSRGYDRDDRDDRGSYGRDRPDSRNGRNGRDSPYERSRNSPISRSPPPKAQTPTPNVRKPSPSSSSPAPNKNMTPEERQAFARAEAQRRIQARMAALGVTAPSSGNLDTSVEDRLLQEKKEAEEKAKAAEKQAEDRERLRKERLENEKALKEGRNTPAPPTPTPTVKVSTPTAPPPAPTPRAAPPAPKPRAPAPPPPRKAPAIRQQPVAPPPAPAPPVVRAAPTPPAEPVIDPEEEKLRLREEAIRKQREERMARLRQLELEEEEAARLEEERIRAREQALKARAKAPSPPPAPPVSAPPAPAPAAPTSSEKSTNPFSRFLKEGGQPPAPASAAVTSPPASNGSTNPWSRPQTAPPPSKSPVPVAVKTSYHTAPSSAVDDEWGDVREKEDNDESSDDEMMSSRVHRANIAQQLFGSILPRPQSAAPGSGPSSPAPNAPTAPPPPPPPAPAPSAPPTIAAPQASSSPGDVNALMRSIQGGMKLRPAKTVDKSAPQVSGRVVGDVAPPSHISSVPKPPSPHSSPPQNHLALPETPTMAASSSSRSSNRQSVDWVASRAADAGATQIDRLPSTAEDDEGDIYETPSAIPDIQVNAAPSEPTSDLMADIDKSIQHRVRSLYAFEGDGSEDLSFGENLVLTAHPSKTGGDWWYGTTLSNGKSGLFPKTYVETFVPKKAHALYSYTAASHDEMSFEEGDEISIVDNSGDEWWKAEKNGGVFIIPASYLEVVEDGKSSSQHIRGSTSALVQLPDRSADMLSSNTHGTVRADQDDDASAAGFHGDDMDTESDSDYLSFDESDDEETTETKQDREAREHERQLVLEAAGLILNQDVKPPPSLVRARSKSHKRRPAPDAPKRASTILASSQPNSLTEAKVLPDIPGQEDSQTQPQAEIIDHARQLDDAFARYEAFRSTQANLNRLSVLSTDSASTAANINTSPQLPPSTTLTATHGLPMAPSLSQSHSHSQSQSKEGEGRYSYFLNLLGRNKTPEGEKRSTLQISAPIISHNVSGASGSEVPSREASPFGTSWASLVDKTALEGIPTGERRRQEAIFELINTEVAYVRDLQLIVEVFYSSLLPVLSQKEVTVVFANVEDLLLTNTTFVSSLEERQKDCRLYVDRIGDILLSHIPHMTVYMEYCVNQSTAIKVLQSLRDQNPELSAHLQRLRDDPNVRNLDLSSYLLAPMQRITRYPLLIKQILHYTESGDERKSIDSALKHSERLLDHINEAIREQEGRETLQKISKNLWIGQGRLDLTAPTRHMGARKLLKEGVLIKSKSGRKLHGFLCSDILVLTDDAMMALYRIPIPLSHAQVRDVPFGKDDLAFQVSQAYPRGGDDIILRTTSVRDTQAWIHEIEHAIRRCKRVEERIAKKKTGTISK